STVTNPAHCAGIADWTSAGTEASTSTANTLPSTRTENEVDTRPSLPERAHSQNLPSQLPQAASRRYAVPLCGRSRTGQRASHWGIMELRDYLHGLRRHWLAVLLITAIGVAVAWGWTLTQKPVYEASASAYISVSENTDSVMPGAGTGNAYARSYVASFMD